MRTAAEQGQRVDALLRMIAEDGATPAGTIPGTDYIGALREAPAGEAQAVADAHRNNETPPSKGKGRD